jgi:hypothetical protein
MKRYVRSDTDSRNTDFEIKEGIESGSASTDTPTL